MGGEKAADVLIVRFSLLLLYISPLCLASQALYLPPSSFQPLVSHKHTAAEQGKWQVAHGLILRCFVKRWLGLPIDFPLQMIFAPGAIAALR